MLPQIQIINGRTAYLDRYDNILCLTLHVLELPLFDHCAVQNVQFPWNLPL